MFYNGEIPAFAESQFTLSATSMVDHGILSPQISNPVQHVETILQQLQDVSLIRKYGLWLATQDPDKALNVRVHQAWAVSPRLLTAMDSVYRY